jgi:hypothetical protein
MADLLSPNYSTFIDKTIPIILNRSKIFDVTKHGKLSTMIKEHNYEHYCNDITRKFIRNFYKSLNIPMIIMLDKKQYKLGTKKNGLHVIKHPMNEYGEEKLIVAYCDGLMILLNITPTESETIGINDEYVTMKAGMALVIFVKKGDTIKYVTSLSENDASYIWFIREYIQSS